MSIRLSYAGGFILSFGMAFSAQAAITGYVLFPDYSGVSGATVTLKSTSASAVTDAAGAFDIDASVEGIVSVPRISRSGTGSLSISVASRAPVHVNVFDLKGKLVRTVVNAELAQGTYEVSPFTGEEAVGVYVVRVSVGDSHKVFQMMRTDGASALAVSKSRSIALKTLSTADSISVTYGGDAAGSVAIWADDGQVDNILITHKVISGAVTRNGNAISDISVSAVSSDGLSLSPDVTLDDDSSTYDATTPWTILNTLRAWTVYVSVTASGTITSASSSNIHDGTMSVNLPVTLMAFSSSSSAKSSSSMITISEMPSSVSSFVNWVWDNRQARGKQDAVENYKNLIFYPIIANGGYLNYCIRWQSTTKLTETYRDKIADMLRRQINAWTDNLTNFEDWPYDTVYVNIVGWAVIDDSIIVNKRSNETVYTAYQETDASFPDISLPRCPDACARPLMYANPNYSSCPNYSSTNDTHFDMSLWGTEGFGADYGGNAGAGGDWGQRVNDIVGIIDQLDVAFPHIAGHETGHGFGLPDYYEVYQIPDDGYSAITGTYTDYVGDWNIVPKMVMWAGSSTVLTEADIWSLRKTWYEIKGNLGY